MRGTALSKRLRQIILITFYIWFQVRSTYFKPNTLKIAAWLTWTSALGLERPCIKLESMIVARISFQSTYLLSALFLTSPWKEPSPFCIGLSIELFVISLLYWPNILMFSYVNTYSTFFRSARRRLSVPGGRLTKIFKITSRYLF